LDFVHFHSYSFLFCKSHFNFYCFFVNEKSLKYTPTKQQKEQKMMNPKYAPLFEPYTLNNGVEIKNRLTVAPLTIYDSGTDGEMTEAGRKFWQNRFEGFGLYIMPFTNVHPSGIGFESPNAFDERHLPTLREYAEIAHAQGAKAVVQIAHSGLRADRSMTQGHDVIAPSGDYFGRFRAMSEQEVWEMVASYAYAAELVMKAGFDGVEIHGANGWQIQQFFSANTNLREDYWGGSLEKRMRFPLAIVDAIDEMRKKHNRPDFIIGYRFSPEEPGDNGITMKETLALVDALLEKPLQYLHISLWDFYKKVRRGAETNLTRMQVVHDRIAGRLPLFGSGNLSLHRRRYAQSLSNRLGGKCIHRQKHYAQPEFGGTN
jgi:2,4-dienoyl-CoA reductase-like NADH-dependent reductase (Old Yellow Enzyme family)